MNILACFFQAGGYNGLEPFLRLMSNRCRLTLSGREAVRRSCNLDTQGFIPVRDLVSPEFDFSRFDLVLTDTINLSRTPEAALCRETWSRAARAGVPSIAFMDSWWGYDERFKLPGEDTPALLPDTMAVVDSLAEKEMLNRGYPPERVKVLGSPLFEELESRGDCQHETARTMRKALGMQEDDFVVVFVSQPLEDVLGPDNEWGFTEKTILTEVLRYLESIQEQEGGLSLVILPHPEEDTRKLEQFAAPLARGLSMRMAGRNHIPVHDLLLSADLVLGMFSILLVEAVVLKRPVLSVQLGLGREDMLVTNMVGATRALRDRENLRTTLTRAVRDATFRKLLLEEHKRFSIRKGACAAWWAEIQALARK